ncbi:Insertion element 4 transposase N-terminal [Klebsiella pneumoniae]|nr:Insertion element 4 transposase N-terminal [Klebsiella pneumoniae]
MRPFAAVIYRGDIVIWMVVVMAFFRNEPITDVVRRLKLRADGEAGINLLARSAVTQERQRVGAAPVEWLFRQTAQTWGAERYLKDNWHGLQLFAIDGAQLRTSDEPRCVNIMALPTHPLSGRAPTRLCVW